MRCASQRVGSRRNLPGNEQMPDAPPAWVGQEKRPDSAIHFLEAHREAL